MDILYLATILGRFEGIAHLYDKGLITPEHAMQQFLRIVHEHQNKQAKQKAS